MSTVKNNSFQNQYGQTISSTDMNNKFDDMQTATLTIDHDNVRSQGIDRINLTGTPVLKAFEYSFNNFRSGGQSYEFFTDDTRSAGQKSLHQLTHTGTGGASVLYLTDDGTAGGNPTTLVAGDLLRLKFGFNFYADTTWFLSQDGVVPTTQSGAFIIFPAYKSTSGGSWQSFDDHIDWFQHGADGPVFNTSTNVGQTYSCPSSDDPSPTSDIWDRGIVCVTTDGLTVSGTGYRQKEIQSHGSFNYITRQQYNIHTVGFFIVGPLWFHDTSPFSGGGRGWEVVTANQASYFCKVERGNFMAQVLQKGKG